MQLSPAELK